MRQTYMLDSAETVNINGWPQNLRYRARSLAGPVLLFVHGGPGVCDRHWVLENQSALADDCVMVCWDQRGAGKSFDEAREKTEKMTVETMIQDLRAVVDYLCGKFGREKLFLLGHSWGTVLCSLYIARYPERVQAYIGMGQFADGPENEALSYRFVWEEALKRNDRKARRDLERIGAPVGGRYKSLHDLTLQRDYLSKFGGGCYRRRESLWNSLLLPLLRSPEYAAAELPGYGRGAFWCLGQLMDEITQLRFSELIPALAVPVYITQGRHDQNTPPELALRWFDGLKAPYKEWIWFENSAHSPIKEEPKLWGWTVADILRRES